MSLPRHVGLLLVAGAWAGPAGAGGGLAARIEQAPAGSVVAIPAGTHAGPLVVDRPLALVGEPGAVIEGTGRGDILTITAPDVAVRGLVLRGTGTSLDQENAGITVLGDRARIEENVLEDVLFGIYVKGAADCVLRGNRIRGKPLETPRRGDAIRVWRADRCRIEGNDIADSRDVVVWFSTGVRILANRVRRGRYGLHFMYSDDNVIEDNRLEDNSVGAFLMYSRNLRLERNVFARNRGPSGYGVGLKDMDGLVARDNRFLANRVGLYIDNSPWSVDVVHRFTRNVFAYNDIGVAFQPAVRRNVFAENAFLENQEQVAVLGAGRLLGNDFAAAGRGNYWSDYRGFDLDEDGLGDLAYRAESLFENLVDREKNLRLFLYSPAQQAIELAARAFPRIRPQPKLTDPAPLMSVPPVRAAALPRPGGRPLAALAAGLLVACAVLVRAGRLPKGDASPGPSPGAPLPEQDPVVRVRGLTKRFGRFTAVEDLSFDLTRGEALALWGRNGAGKTTAIRCLLGLLRCSGRLEVAGSDVRRDGKSVRRALGYVPQELALDEDLVTREALRFYARLKKVPSSRVDEVLAEVGMREHAAKRIGELSGGMKQRIALAVALLGDPPVLLLDELTANLDPDARGGFLRLLARQRERGKSILFTSHRVDEVVALADRVLVLEEGRLAAACGPAELPELLGLCVRMRLRVGDGETDRALTALRGRGLDVSPGGRGDLEVRVPAAGKLEVIRALDRAGVSLVDFEMEAEPPGSDGTEGGR